jgi:hypothetical protein
VQAHRHAAAHRAGSVGPARSRSILAGSYALSPNTSTEDELAALNPPLPGGHPDGHGTYMAMLAAAPANGWGMVGLAPTSVRIFNMKALAAGQTTFSFSEYGSAISACQALTATMPVSVVNLSLGSATQPSGEELDELDAYVRSAHKVGLGVVAAVGNEGGAVQAPADLPEVLGVGASDANPSNLGVTCPFSNSGLGQIVSEGMAAYQAANPAPAQPSNTGPPAATLIPSRKAAAPKPKIVRISFKHHRLTITFRVTLPDTGAQGYPYTHGPSNTVAVHVDP